ncbi:MAG TPA: hotdog fold thioesterase [Symbiobacteriaceae bacterium]|nr:hotdog fold thioesterase [Symbiobacteriaceae bacterium]
MNLADTLGIHIEESTPQRVVATMPVDERTHQPFGLLHGGASVALAETVASIGAHLNAGEGRTAVGMEINANHIRPKRSGIVRAVATPAHIGKASSVWEIKITDEEGKLVCISRCTLAFVGLA